MFGTPRNRKRPAAGLHLLSIPLILFALSDRASPAPPQDAERLDRLLASAAEYCERVKAIAFNFVCIEDIEEIQNFFGEVSSTSAILRDEKIFTTRRIKRRTFSHDYQLIKKAGEIVERRILLKENGRKTRVENADLSRLKYSSQYQLFGPVGFLSRYWQDRFAFSIVGEESLNGETAVVVRAVPREFREENFNIGRIWINEASQILRIEWEPDSILNYADEIITTSRGEFHKTVRWTVDYSFEKNGIRFPGRQLIQEIFYRDTPSGRRQQAVKRETTFTYRDFKFFVVDTDVDVGRKKS